LDFLSIAIVDVFVNSIFLFDDKLIIKYNWKSGTKTVTLKQLEKSAKQAGIDLTESFECSYFDDNRPPV